jgi:hypothetical protein
MSISTESTSYVTREYSNTDVNPFNRFTNRITEHVLRYIASFLSNKRFFEGLPSCSKGMKTLSSELRTIINSIDANNFFIHTLIRDPFRLFLDRRNIADTTSTIHGLYLKRHTSVCHSLSLKHDIEQSISPTKMETNRNFLSNYLKTNDGKESLKGVMKKNIEKYDDSFIEDLSRLLASYKRSDISSSITPFKSFELVFRNNISGISFRETEKRLIYKVNFKSTGFKQPLTIELKYVFDMQNTSQKNVLAGRCVMEIIPGSNDEFHGQGTFTHYRVDGTIHDKYVGGFENDKCHGQGTFIQYRVDGTIQAQYVGGFENNKRHGQGTLTWYGSDGTIDCKYVGAFENSNGHGQGTWTCYRPDGTLVKKYVGAFVDDNYNGHGTWTFYRDDGQTIKQKYVGAFESDEYHGHGRKTWYREDGTLETKYVGAFVYNNLHGQGTLTNYYRVNGTIGSKYVGGFENGKMHGQGTLTIYQVNGKTFSKYVGGFENDEKHGQGISMGYRSDGTVAWTHDECMGIWY